MKRVLMIVGSLRKNSLNHQLAMVVKEMVKEKVEVRVLEYADLPFMNQDFEVPTPASVTKVRQHVLAADGIWIFSPEYNYQIPGVLKNLLDWLSRPLDLYDWERGSAVKGKPVTVSSVAGKSAGAGVRRNLSELLENMSMNVIGGAGTGVALDADAFQTDRLLLSEEDTSALEAQAELFLLAM